ncbi:(deoxy)nucleoside triphosphate pyrophosphohydrolase [Halalkalibacter urbisdiaboli]|uniref:(deoxy)nucleoside triphosphate pyrophosphohydrolase n=1 Tax=Halalkalibacter urbisdiaboli TaxID=1960589 RepID=UPI000B434E84|nr:(deoxy)nucleoside triphosphate pyrophosphohydrolase [Halalkalibacter urbisdiaboli]
MKKVQVVAAVINNEQSHILCALRSPTMSLAHHWEFPGGKIEDGESPEEALTREIREELDCEIKVSEKIESVTHRYPNVLVHLLTYHATIISGFPKAKEHADLKWIPLEQLDRLRWAPADIPTVELLLKQIRS